MYFLLNMQDIPASYVPSWKFHTSPLKMDGWKVRSGFLLDFGNFSGANCSTSPEYTP